MTNAEEKLQLVKDNINAYQDFPKPGILFRDVFSVMKNPLAFKCLMDLIYEHVKNLKKPIDAVVGLDSRGFLFGPLIALNFNIPFVPVRKGGKLPGSVTSIQYQLEYGSAVFEMQEDSIKPGQSVIVIDDLLATGGSLKSTCSLIQKMGGKVVECIVVIELCDLKGRDKLTSPIYSFVQY